MGGMCVLRDSFLWLKVMSSPGARALLGVIEVVRHEKPCENLGREGHPVEARLGLTWKAHVSTLYFVLLLVDIVLSFYLASGHQILSILGSCLGQL